MVEKFKNRFINPFVITTFIFAILIYCGFIKVANRYPFISVLPIKSINGISGQIVSNPVINSNGRFYSLVLSVDYSFAPLYIKLLPVKSSCTGRVQCLIPANIVEVNYPGKLFSSFGKNIIIEKGERFFLSGKFNSDYFIVNDCQNLQTKKCIKEKIIKLRSFSRIQFKRLMFSWKDAGGLILALLSGSKEYTDNVLTENFRKAGLSHILALSGMHLSFFAGIASVTGKKIFGKKFSNFLRIIGILVFIWFAGLTPSLLRALLCSLIVIFCSSVFSLDVDYFIILCSVFLLHCVIAPQDIFSLAFILSYGALAGILLLSDFINSKICCFVPNKISNSLSSSVGAQLTTAPISIVFFGCFMPCGILASVVVSPLVSIFIFIGMFSIIICLIMPFLSPLFGSIMNILYSIIDVTVSLFALVPPIILKGN